MSPKEVKLTSEQKEKILRNVWVLHDGRWFLKAIEELGFDTATKLNLAVTKSFGKTEIKQFIAQTDYGKVKNIDDLESLMEILADLYFPEEHKYEFKPLDNSSLLGHVLECYVYKNLSRAGITEIHQCAAKTRFDSWLKALGLEGEAIADKNTSNCNGTCKIIFKIRW